MGWKKKEERALFKNKISATIKTEGKKKQPKIWGSVCVLYIMVVTFPTCHAERSPLKVLAPSNTAPHSNKEKSNNKNGIEKKRGESIVQKWNQYRHRRKKKEKKKKRRE